MEERKQLCLYVCFIKDDKQGIFCKWFYLIFLCPYDFFRTECGALSANNLAILRNGVNFSGNKDC